MDLKKTKKILNTLFILILVFLILGAWVFAYCYILAVALTVLYMVIYLKHWHCPKCGKLLGRGVNIRCPHCGEETGITMRF